MFKIYGGKTKFSQWDKNQKLVMDGLPVGAEVYFYNDPNDDEPLITEVYEIVEEETEIKLHVCDVPNILLTTTSAIKVQIPNRVKGLYGVMHSITGPHEKYFEVEPAEKPEDYLYEQTSIIGQSDLSQTNERAADYVKGIIRKESLPDGYPYIESSEEILLPETTMYADSGYRPYHDTYQQLIEGETYTVLFDGVEYTCVAKQMISKSTKACYGIGNNSLMHNYGTVDSNYPFCIVSEDRDSYAGYYAVAWDTMSNTDLGPHTVKMYIKSTNVSPIASELLPKAEAISDLTDAPTMENFNELLAALREVGILATE